jgi:hypothetical protein
MEEGNVAYTVTLRGRSIEVKALSVGSPSSFFMTTGKGGQIPTTYELHACPRAADKSQIEDFGRRKNDEAPTPAYMIRRCHGNKEYGLHYTVNLSCRHGI